VYKERAKKTLLDLEKDPGLSNNLEIQYLRSVMLHKDTPNVDVDIMLIDLLDSNSSNRMAYEYLMALYLMSREVDKIVENLYRLEDLGYDEIPGLIQEAVCIHALNTGEEIDLLGYTLSPETVERYNAFSDIMSSSSLAGRQDALKTFAVKYPGSYFFYYVFSLSGEVK
jgi:hypothetical protein